MNKQSNFPTRDQIEGSKAKVQAGWSDQERCLRRLVSILRQRQLAAQLAAFESKVLTSRAG